jgi:hypothetical protein
VRRSELPYARVSGRPDPAIAPRPRDKDSTVRRARRERARHRNSTAPTAARERSPRTPS